MFKGISPTTTIFALFLAIFVAASIGSLLSEAAVIIIESTSSTGRSLIEEKKFLLSPLLVSSGSIPKTSEPCASPNLHTS